LAGAALLGRLNWQIGEVVELILETPRVKSIVLDVPDWLGHRAGQHVDVRLTAEDGYRAERSYSIASAPGDEVVTLTIERLPDGEVSSYLVDELRAGDGFELRGPIGGYFTWSVADGGPVLLVGGGSGIIPLMAMARHRAGVGADTPMRLLYSSRSLDDVIYRDELASLAAAGDGFEVVHTLTRAQPVDWEGYARRVDAELLEEVAWPATDRPLAYVCGPTRFVEAVANALVELGHDPARVKTERFGPTG